MTWRAISVRHYLGDELGFEFAVDDEVAACDLLQRCRRLVPLERREEVLTQTMETIGEGFSGTGSHIGEASTRILTTTACVC